MSSAVVGKDRPDGLGEPGADGLAVWEQVGQMPAADIPSVPHVGEAPGWKLVLRMQQVGSFAGLRGSCRLSGGGSSLRAAPELSVLVR